MKLDTLSNCGRKAESELPVGRRTPAGRGGAYWVDRRTGDEVVIARRLTEARTDGSFERVVVDDAEARSYDGGWSELVGSAESWLEVIPVLRVGIAVVRTRVLQAAVQGKAGNGWLERIGAGGAEVRDHPCCISR